MTEGLKVKFEFTPAVVDNVSITWVMTKPGLLIKLPNVADDFAK
jgi:hypothetical protein